MLFKSLHTLAGQCPAIIITVSRDGGDRLRVNVMPKAPTDDAGKLTVKEGAMFTPISLSGTPDELDAGFGEALKGYTETRRDLRTAVDEARTTMAAATKSHKPSAPAKPAPKPAPAPAAPGAASNALAAVKAKYTPPAGGTPVQGSISSADLFKVEKTETPAIESASTEEPVIEEESTEEEAAS